jgi:DNA-binding transcriptional regulator YhcF (GntR family)
MGRKRRMEVTPPVYRYEQLADSLRRRIFSGEFPPDSKLPSGTELARDPQLKMSQHTAQRALEVLEDEGLALIEVGRGTTVLGRRSWHLEFEARVPLDDRVRAKAVQAAAAALRAGTEGHPGISGATVMPSAAGFLMSVTVESAHLGGAVAAAFPIAQDAAGEFPIVVISGSEA